MRLLCCDGDPVNWPVLQIYACLITADHNMLLRLKEILLPHFSVTLFRVLQ